MMSGKILMMILATTLMSIGVFGASFENLQTSVDTHSHAKRTTASGVGGNKVCGYRILEFMRENCPRVTVVRKSDPLFLAPLYEEIEMPLSNSMDDENSPTDGFGDNVIDFSETEVTPWIRSPSKLVGKIHPRFRRSRNIIQDCCQKPCSINHMLSFCP